MKKLLLLTLLVTNVIKSFTYEDEEVTVNNNEQLLEAATTGNIILIKSLLKLPETNIDTQDNEGITPLMRACFMAKFKVSKCGDKKCNNDCGIEVVKLLLKSGCNVNAEDLTNKTALYYACLNANYDVVNILLEHKARISKEIAKYVKDMKKLYESVNWNKNFHAKKARLYGEIDFLFDCYLRFY